MDRATVVGRWRVVRWIERQWWGGGQVDRATVVGRWRVARWIERHWFLQEITKSLLCNRTWLPYSSMEASDYCSLTLKVYAVTQTILAAIADILQTPWCYVPYTQCNHGNTLMRGLKTHP